MPRGLSEYDSAKLQGRLWTPDMARASARPGMWLDCSDTSTYTVDADGVNTLRDKAGIVANFTQSTASSKPKVVTHAASGLPALSFDGTDWLSSTSGITSGSYSGDLTFLYFATRTSVGSGAGGDLFTERLVAAGQGGYLLVWAEFASTYYIADGVTVSLSVFDLLLQDGAVVVQNHRSGLTNQLWVNGASQTVTGATGNITGTNGSYLGTRSGSVGPWEGLVGELIALTSTPDTYDMQLYEGYLAWKWNRPLVATHRFANRPPLNGD